MQSHIDPGLLHPDDLTFLQGCFDEIIKREALERGSESARDVASALVMAYQRGVREREALMHLASGNIEPWATPQRVSRPSIGVIR